MEQGLAQLERGFMNTKEITREQVSAFVDGECADTHMEVVLAALRLAEGKSDWDIYHQIGDMLRSDDMAVSWSPGFAARMAARLDAEPTIIAPAIAGKSIHHVTKESRAFTTRPMKRWALPSVFAAAAAAVTAFIAIPQLMVATKGEPDITSMMVASSGGARLSKARASIPNAGPGGVITTSLPEGVVMRDARIDEYLLAHQRFSPSVYSTAQYARSATFATDSDR